MHYRHDPSILICSLHIVLLWAPSIEQFSLLQRFGRDRVIVYASNILCYWANCIRRKRQGPAQRSRVVRRSKRSRDTPVNRDSRIRKRSRSRGLERTCSSRGGVVRHERFRPSRETSATRTSAAACSSISSHERDMAEESSRHGTDVEGLCSVFSGVALNTQRDSCQSGALDLDSRQTIECEQESGLEREFSELLIRWAWWRSWVLRKAWLTFAPLKWTQI